MACCDTPGVLYDRPGGLCGLLGPGGGSFSLAGFAPQAEFQVRQAALQAGDGGGQSVERLDTLNLEAVRLGGAVQVLVVVSLVPHG